MRILFTSINVHHAVTLISSKTTHCVSINNKIMSKVFTLVSFLPLLALSACPDDTWTPGADPDTCYRVSPGHMGWHAAHQWCGQRGGYLAEVNTMAEQKAL